MKHLEYAKSKADVNVEGFIEIEGNKITFTVQDFPVGDVGVTGLQVTPDLLKFCKDVIYSLNKVHPCRENSLTITKIEEALHWQEARTKDRVARNVEGQYLD